MNPGFVREVYCVSPSVDLELLDEGEQVDCCKHTIKMSVYDEMLKEFCETGEARMTANMWMLMFGPQLVEDLYPRHWRHGRRGFGSVTPGAGTVSRTGIRGATRCAPDREDEFAGTNVG